jgi:hypothetical protein
MRSAARVPRRADDYGNARAHCFAQHKPNVALDSFTWSASFARSEIMRSGVCTPGVASDKVNSVRDGLEQAFLRESSAEISGSSNCSYFVHRTTVSPPSPNLHEQEFMLRSLRLNLGSIITCSSKNHQLENERRNSVDYQ